MEEEKKLAGFLLIDKPNGRTSFQCVAYIRKLLPYKAKVGHAGTLDSFATGLLIIAVDRRATREIDQFMKLSKVYVATGKLGQLTDTLDLTGVTVQEQETLGITCKQLELATDYFGDSYQQIPPIYSALKYEGRQLSELLRKHKMTREQLQEVAKQKVREVQIYNLELLKCELPYFTVRTHVSHGTYIRVLVNDIAQKVSSVATTHELRRDAIGPFSIKEAVPLDSFMSVSDIEKHLIFIDEMLKRLAYKIPD